jgi:hypothetical protein
MPVTALRHIRQRRQQRADACPVSYLAPLPITHQREASR